MGGWDDNVFMFSTTNIAKHPVEQVQSQSDTALVEKLQWALRKEANMLKMTISEIHLDLGQDYIFI